MNMLSLMFIVNREHMYCTPIFANNYMLILTTKTISLSFSLLIMIEKFARTQAHTSFIFIMFVNAEKI